ncbi:MAG TPA: phosphate signaling complex protein PhoU [Acidimicrobiia bacterium]|nr:phosphate signaling complex protein PhoU [Acidimicrobiia bacterium]
MAPTNTPVPEGPQEVRRTFTDQLDEIRGDVVRLAGLTSEAIGAATHCLLEADLTAVDALIVNDRRIDALKEATELRVYELFATQQPMARDLRTLLAVLRILTEIQLTADLTVSIAKAARRLYPAELAPKVRGLIRRMGEQATTQQDLAVDAFADGDAAIAAALPDMDDVMDDLQKDMFREIFASSVSDESGLQTAVQLALLGRFYERIADHAVLVGAWTEFMETGRLPSRSDDDAPAG